MNVGILGLSFKQGTDDMRESPSLDLIPNLVKIVKEVKVYDPVAMKEASKYIKNVNYSKVKDKFLPYYIAHPIIRQLVLSKKKYFN